MFLVELNKNEILQIIFIDVSFSSNYDKFYWIYCEFAQFERKMKRWYLLDSWPLNIDFLAVECLVGLC